VYATGIVEPTHWAKVAALQRKRIVDLCHCEGRTVVKGDVLARLDDVEEKAVLAELEARLKRFKEDAERLRLLLDRNATTRTLYEDKLTQVREYEARVSAQKDRILDLELRAPMDGVVLRRDGEIGEIAGINANDVLFWVGQPKPLRVVAEISEDDIARVKDGQKVLLRHEGLAGQMLTAVVGALTPKGDPQTKTFRAYLTLPDDTQLKIGMSIEANVVVREAADVVLLPAEAVTDGAVIRIVDGRARRTPVVLGIRGTRMVEVRSGVSPGDIVVSPYRGTLKDGTRVRSATTP
jgi:RND family efflux transporter MFP subunit